MENLSKRAVPSIDRRFSTEEHKKIVDAFRDALRLAKVAVKAIDAAADDRSHKIFNKYFNERDRALVRRVFKKILGDPVDLDMVVNGHAKLRNIRVIKPNRYIPSDWYECYHRKSTFAVLSQPLIFKPKLYLCPLALWLPNFPASFDNPEILKRDCSYIGESVSTNMEVLGGTILHEYTYFRKVVRPPLSSETDDKAYGPAKVRALDKKLATMNADSYQWFALEAMWTELCQVEYQEPWRNRPKPWACISSWCGA